MLIEKDTYYRNDPSEYSLEVGGRRPRFIYGAEGEPVMGLDMPDLVVPLWLTHLHKLFF